MRNSILAAVGAVALAIGSAAGAAVTVSSTSVVNLNDPNPSATTPASVVTNGTTTTINFGFNALPLSDQDTFQSQFTIEDTLAGIYSVDVGTSSAGVDFTSGSLQLLVNGIASGAPIMFDVVDNGLGLRLWPPGVTLAAGDYQLTINGTASAQGSFTGNVTILAAPVPEAATWAMMLVGFGAIGFTMRTRRRTALAQIA